MPVNNVNDVESVS